MIKTKLSRGGLSFVSCSLLSAPAYAEVLDKMGGCAGYDPWFATSVGLASIVLLTRSKTVFFALGQVYTIIFFGGSLFLWMGVALGFGDPVWKEFTNEINVCDRYSVIGFWPMQVLALLVWFIPLMLHLLRKRRDSTHRR